MTETGFYLTDHIAYSVRVVDDHAYAADCADGSRIIDISNSSDPVEVGYYDTGDRANGVFVHDDYIFLADLDAGFYIFENDLLSSIETLSNNRPSHIFLEQNYPNPFNPITTIKYDLPVACNVQLIVYNLSGQKVASLVETSLSPGSHSVDWNASNHASGIYLYQLTAGNNVSVKKCLVLK